MDPEQQIPTSTPLPHKEEQTPTLSFLDAIRELINGRRITKLEWGTNNIYCLFTDDTISINTDGKVTGWVISGGDIQGNDWIVLP